MLIGTMNINRVLKKSKCRTSEDYKLTRVGDYKIHATALMPCVPFESAKIFSEFIDSSIFINADDTKLFFSRSIKIQNYLTTKYIGRAPYTFYGKATKFGEEFDLICEEGDPSYKRRYFGTEAAIGNVNPNANDMVYYNK